MSTKEAEITNRVRLHELDDDRVRMVLVLEGTRREVEAEAEELSNAGRLRADRLGKAAEAATKELMPENAENCHRKLSLWRGDALRPGLLALYQRQLNLLHPVQEEEPPMPSAQRDAFDEAAALHNDPNPPAGKRREPIDHEPADVRAWLALLGIEVPDDTVEHWPAEVREEVARWAKAALAAREAEDDAAMDAAWEDSPDVIRALLGAGRVTLLQLAPGETATAECATCEGTGDDDVAGDSGCPDCGGSGRVPRADVIEADYEIVDDQEPAAAREAEDDAAMDDDPYSPDAVMDALRKIDQGAIARAIVEGWTPAQRREAIAWVEAILARGDAATSIATPTHVTVAIARKRRRTTPAGAK